MADNVVRLNPIYFPDPEIGRPIALADIFIGEPDLDPEILANRKTVNVLQESGVSVPIAAVNQPLQTGAGGVVLYNGSPVTLSVDGDYSLKVLDSLEGQDYYIPRDVSFVAAVVETSFNVDNIFGLINLTPVADGDVSQVSGYFTSFPQTTFVGGGVFVWQADANKDTANGGTIIDPDNIGGFDGTPSTRDAFLAAQGGGVGDGVWVREDTDDVNVYGFGSIGDNTFDDTAAIQASIDVGSKVVDTDVGHYKVSRIVGRSNLNLIGSGTFDFSANVDYASDFADPLVLFQGVAGSAILLVANANAEAITLTITDTTSLSAGDLIEVATPTDDGGFVDTSITVANGELFEIASVDSVTEVTLKTPVLDLNGYRVADGGQVRLIDPIDNVTIGTDIKMIGKGRPQPTGTGDIGIVFYYGRDINIHCDIDFIDARSVYLVSCFNYRVTGMEINHNPKGVSDAVNYAISPACSSTFGEVSGNTLVSARHGVASSHLSTSTGFLGVVRVVDVHSNLINGTWHAGVSTHNDTELMTVRNNNITGCEIGVNPRERRLNVIDNIMIDCDQHISCSSHPSQLRVEGNICYRGGAVVTFGNIGAGFDVDDVSIINNVGYNTSGLQLAIAAPATKHKNLTVKGNVLYNSDTGGGSSAAIRVDGDYDTGQISENSVFGNTDGSGIRVDDGSDGLEVMRNTVRNVSLTAFTFEATLTDVYAIGNTYKGYNAGTTGTVNLANSATFSADNTDMGAS